MELCYHSLSCVDHQLESIYEQEQVKTLVVVDRTLSAFKLLVTVILVASILLGLLPAPPAAVTVWLIYMSMLLLQQLIIRRHTEFYMQHRLPVVLLFKVALSGCLMGLVVTNTLEPVHNWGTFAKVLFMGAGIVMVNCTGVLMPVFFRHHAPMTLAIVTTFNALFLPSVVDTVLCTPSSQQYLQQLHSTIESAAFQLGSAVVPVTVDNKGVVSDLARAQAYTLVLWLQLYLGVLVPSIYLYMFELRSRLQFLQRTSQAGPHPPHITRNRTNTEAPTAEASTEAMLQHPWLSSSSTPSNLPPNLMVFLHCFMLLLGVAVWNLLHLAGGWLVWAGDHVPTAVWMQQFMRRHGARDCIRMR